MYTPSHSSGVPETQIVNQKKCHVSFIIELSCLEPRQTNSRDLQAG